MKAAKTIAEGITILRPRISFISKNLRRDGRNEPGPYLLPIRACFCRGSFGGCGLEWPRHLRLRHRSGKPFPGADLFRPEHMASGMAVSCKYGSGRRLN